MYVHAEANAGQCGVALNAKSSAVIDSYLAGFRHKNADSQAIAGSGGPGPYRIVNNYLEAASQNILFGSDNFVPSDIQICGNHLKKDAAWNGGGWRVNNLVQLDNARRVLVAGNVMENYSAGFAVLLASGEDVTLAYNIVRHASSGLNIASSVQLARAVVRDNLWDLDPAQSGGDGRAFQFINGGGGARDIKIDHNTTTRDKNPALTLGDKPKYGQNFVFTHNLVPHGDYGVIGSEGAGKASLDFFLISYKFDHNAIFGGGAASDYPPGNFFPSIDGVGFAPDWSLKPGGKFKGAGSDGRDLGADIAGLYAATAGVAP